MDPADFFHTGYNFFSYVEKLGDDGLKMSSRYDRWNLREEDRSFFGGINQPVHILVLSEAWCPDCVNNVPIIAKLSETNPDIKVMVFPRDDYPKIMDLYETDNKRIIPTVIFFDQHFNEIGRWIERPASVQKILEEGTEEEKKEVKKRYMEGAYIDEVVGEIKEIISKGLEDAAEQ